MAGPGTLEFTDDTFDSEVLESDTPVLVDFGLVRQATSSGLTRTGDFLGTPSYAAPEQLRGDTKLVAARADVLSHRRDEGVVGKAGLGFVTATDEYLGTPQPRVDADLVGQTRLSDPRLPREHDE